MFGHGVGVPLGDGVQILGGLQEGKSAALAFKVGQFEHSERRSCSDGCFDHCRRFFGNGIQRQDEVPRRLADTAAAAIPFARSLLMVVFVMMLRSKHDGEVLY